MKQLLIMCVMLIALSSFSQSTTDSITISTSQAKAAIINAKKVKTLQQQLQVQNLIIATDSIINSNLNKELYLQKSKYQLLNENYSILNTQYISLQTVKKPNNVLRNIVIIVGVFSTGYLIGGM